MVVAGLLSNVFQANACSLPRFVSSLCRSRWSVAYPRYGRSFSPIAFCLAEIELFYWHLDSSNVLGFTK